MLRVVVLAATGVLAACSGPQMVAPGDAGIEVLLPYPDDGGAVLWDGWAGAFVADYCVQCHNPAAPCGGNGCHAPGDPALFDLRQESAVVERAPTIRCGIATVQDPTWNCGSTKPEEFPIVGESNALPAPEQRALVVGWIEAGCP